MAAPLYAAMARVPERFAELYKPADDGNGYVFDWAQVEGLVDPAEVDRLHDELRRERLAHRRSKHQAATSDAREPTDEERAQREEYERLAEERERLEFELHKRTEAAVGERVERIVAERVAALEGELAGARDELQDIRQELEELRAGEAQRVETDARLQAIRDALPRFAFVEGVEADLVMHADGPDGLVVRDGRVRSARGESVADWVERLARSRPHWSRNVRRPEAPRSLFR